MNLGIAGKVALVTGGARGIGAGIAKAIAAEGVKVAITSRSLPAEEPPEEVDILVNNVGHTLDITDPYCSELEWSQVLHLNLFHALRWTNKYLPAMKTKGWGRIINITSCAGLENSGPVTYCVAKAALTAYTRSMGRVLAHDAPGVVMCALYPSVIKTEGGHWDKADPAHAAKYLSERVPTGRFQTVEEFAQVVAFYCGEQSRACHGAIISVDQGQSRHYSAHNYL
jgi:NAD(P)-dependent dehydrogenase (short-subunit alcohol dehydrogenase family)